MFSLTGTAGVLPVEFQTGMVDLVPQSHRPNVAQRSLNRQLADAAFRPGPNPPLALACCLRRFREHLEW
jgi:hypothetical protein